LGLKTRVGIVKGGTNFDYNKMDKTDGVAIISSVEDLLRIAYKFNPKAGELLDNEANPERVNPGIDREARAFGRNLYFESTLQYNSEKANGGGYYHTGNIIALERTSAEQFAAAADLTFEETIALGIVHGAGHLAGLPHAGEDIGIVTLYSVPNSLNVMSDGETFKSVKKRLEDFMTHKDSNGEKSIIRKFFEARFGTESAMPANGIEIDEEGQ
jgi:hypothetical protein